MNCLVLESSSDDEQISLGTPVEEPRNHVNNVADEVVPISFDDGINRIANSDETNLFNWNPIRQNANESEPVVVRPPSSPKTINRNDVLKAAPLNSAPVPDSNYIRMEAYTETKFSLKGKRVFFRFLVNGVPEYSAKIKGNTKDGRVFIDKGNDPHFSNSAHEAIMIIANNVTDISLREKSSTGIEHVTVRYSPANDHNPQKLDSFLHNVPRHNYTTKVISKITDESFLLQNEQGLWLIGQIFNNRININYFSSNDKLKACGIAFGWLIFKSKWN